MLSRPPAPLGVLDRRPIMSYVRYTTHVMLG